MNTASGCKNVLLVFIAIFCFLSFEVSAQLTVSGGTEYTGAGQQNKVFIFCAGKNNYKANLKVSTLMDGALTYNWQKYDPVAATFLEYGANQSSISSLEDGGYRVTVTNGTQTETYTAWVFNDYFEVTASISESTCESFKLNGSYDSPKWIYYDLSTNQPNEINKNIKFQWKEGSSNLAQVLSFTRNDPPYTDTQYYLSVSDDFCSGEAQTTYTSIVPMAKFSASKDGGEAPLEVAFKNESVNATAGKYEWFFYKDIDQIKREALIKLPVDEIQDKAYDDDVTYTYEHSGKYQVKLVAKKISELETCTDTFFLPGYIEVDTSFVKAPNFFTPNGDGSNDKFVVKFWSVEQIKISIFNRWGKRVHQWESGEIKGFENTVTKISESVWDGRIGNSMASPGVYYYVVEAQGRDGKTRRAHGFVHLFRDKDSS